MIKLTCRVVARSWARRGWPFAAAMTWFLLLLCIVIAGGLWFGPVRRAALPELQAYCAEGLRQGLRRCEFHHYGTTTMENGVELWAYRVVVQQPNQPPREFGMTFYVVERQVVGLVGAEPD